MLLVSNYGGEDITGWFWSRKIDGFGCEWNGAAFVSRAGNEYDVPQAWADAMPERPLHGELFAGSWSKTLSAVTRGAWDELRFYVFDRMSKRPFTERIATMPELPDFCELVPHAPVFSTAHAKHLVGEFFEDGICDGIVVRRPDVGYFNGRSADVLKLKPWQDAEATVLQPIFKTYKTIPSSHLVRSDDGLEFKVQHIPRETQPGSRITFKFCGRHTDGAPKHPQFLRVAA